MTHRHSLSTRDRLIIEHVAQYRLTTNRVLGSLFLRGVLDNAVTKVSSRLCRHEFLRRHPFYHPRVYFTLGVRGASLQGLPETRTLPLGPQALPVEYGVLSYATLGQRLLRRLSPTEVEGLIPGVDKALVEQPYCLESGDSNTLELVRVDLGGGADHVARKADADVRARMESGAFRPIVRSGRFRLVIVTATAEKGAAIRDALDRRMWPQGLALHIAIVPDLLLLTVRGRS